MREQTNPMETIVVLITAPSKEEAEKIGSHLVETKRAACANILPNIHSIFFWEGKRCQEQEALLVLKTRKTLFKPLCEAVVKIHSYAVPEIIAIDVVDGAPAYLQWVEDNTRE